MIDYSLVSPRCRDCTTRDSCGGLAKHTLTVEELANIPAPCFVKEVDLTEADIRLISKPKREGAHIALIDALKRDEREKLKEAVGFIDWHHYWDNQKPWADKAKDLFVNEYQRKPNVDEEFELNSFNDPRFRLQYLLLFPEMVEIVEKAPQERKDRLRRFLMKADEVIIENIKVNRYIGAPHIFRVHMRYAAATATEFKPSYVQTIFHGKLLPVETQPLSTL